MANAEATVKKTRPHNYTQEERLALGSKIAETLDEHEQIDLDKKQAMAEFKVLEQEVDNKLKTLRDNHKKGYEIREFECYVRRDQSTQLVEYVTIDGTIIDSHKFTAADWNIVMGKAQLGMFPEEEAGPDESEIRAHADAVAAGQTPIDFEPAAITVSLPNWDAERQAQYNNLCATTVGMSLEDLKATLKNVNSPAPFKDEQEATVYGEFGKYLKGKIEGLQELADNPGPYASTEVPPTADVDPEDALPSLDGTPSWADDESTDDTDEEEGDDEPSDDDEPQPTPPPTKRPAKRIDPK